MALQDVSERGLTLSVGAIMAIVEAVIIVCLVAMVWMLMRRNRSRY